MSRGRQLRKQAKKGCLPSPYLDGLTADRANVRGRAVRTLCPCRAGWDAYETHRNNAEALCKDDDGVVRANALHVREDALLAELLDANKASARAARARRIDREADKRATLTRRQRAHAKRSRMA